VRRFLDIAIGFVLAIACLNAATLERLSLEEMTTKSTSIVRGQVTSSWSAFSGPVIYTHFKIVVAERLKGSGTASVEIVVPGGVANNMRQTFSGTPELEPGKEYVLFLWTGSNGMTQLIGLTQGLFTLGKDSPADPTVTRSASREMMLDRSTGQPVKDQPMVMRMSELRSRVAGTLGAKGRK
jgi:hypothetical protein